MTSVIPKRAQNRAAFYASNWSGSPNPGAVAIAARADSALARPCDARDRLVLARPSLSHAPSSA